MEKQKKKYAHTHTQLHFLKLINIFWMSSLTGLKIISSTISVRLYWTTTKFIWMSDAQPILLASELLTLI